VAFGPTPGFRFGLAMNNDMRPSEVYVNHSDWVIAKDRVHRLAFNFFLDPRKPDASYQQQSQAIR
jgi:hypothetical protein